MGVVLAGLALLILVRDFAATEIEGDSLALSVPFALIGTMGAIIVLELLFAAQGRRAPPHPFRALSSTRIIRRGWQVTG